MEGEVGKTRLAEYKAIRPLIPHDLAQPVRSARSG